MSNDHVNPVMREMMDEFVQPLAQYNSGIKVAFAADHQMIDAAMSRIQHLESSEKELQTENAYLKRQVEILKSQRDQLSAFCDSFCDWEQLMTGENEPTPVDQDVVIEALKILRDRHIVELEEIIELLHRKWLAQFWT